MIHYAILLNPGHNRVYFEETKKLSVSELMIVLETLSVDCSDIKQNYISGIFYLTFSAGKDLTNEDMIVLWRLSFVYAIFQVIKKDSEILLLPIQKPCFQYMDESISGILKYSGKTNEIFTRMMINVAVFSSDFCKSNNIRLLDPLAGKGTTLFEGLIMGYDVFGIEIGDKAVKETSQYLKKYLEKEKFKHTSKTETVYDSSKLFKAKRYRFEIAKNKEDVKNKSTKIFEIISGDSVYANRYYKKNSFHVIVGDLPYGVHHGNVTNKNQSSLTRNPKELLEACLKGWRDILLPGGTIVLAWNKFVLSREEMVNVMKSCGFVVFNENPYLSFEHRVDQAIKRDIIVGKKL